MAHTTFEHTVRMNLLKCRDQRTGFRVDHLDRTRIGNEGAHQQRIADCCGMHAEPGKHVSVIRCDNGCDSLLLHGLFSAGFFHGDGYGY